jgi:hypothetical protein
MHNGLKDLLSIGDYAPGRKIGFVSLETHFTPGIEEVYPIDELSGGTPVASGVSPYCDGDSRSTVSKRGKYDLCF